MINNHKWRKSSVMCCKEVILAVLNQVINQENPCWTDRQTGRDKSYSFQVSPEDNL